MRHFWTVLVTDLFFLLFAVSGSLILIAIFELLMRWNRWRKVRFAGHRH